jgi:hypothetical protein
LQIFIDLDHEHDSRQPVTDGNADDVPVQSIPDEDSEGAIFDDGVLAEVKLAQKCHEYMYL